MAKTPRTNKGRFAKKAPPRRGAVSLASVLLQTQLFAGVMFVALVLSAPRAPGAVKEAPYLPPCPMTEAPGIAPPLPPLDPHALGRGPLTPATQTPQWPDNVHCFYGYRPGPC